MELNPPKKIIGSIVKITEEQKKKRKIDNLPGKFSSKIFHSSWIFLAQFFDRCKQSKIQFNNIKCIHLSTGVNF